MAIDWNEMGPRVFAALASLQSNEHVSLGDLVYVVRDREGEGWNGKWVSHWDQAVAAAEQITKEVQAKLR